MGGHLTQSWVVRKGFYENVPSPVKYRRNRLSQANEWEVYIGGLDAHRGIFLAEGALFSLLPWPPSSPQTLMVCYILLKTSSSLLLIDEESKHLWVQSLLNFRGFKC